MKTQTKDTWKAIAAYAYMTICVFDFLVMPAYTSYLNQRFIEETISELEPDSRAYVLEVIDRISLESWSPVTTNNTGGMIFHISFGMILGGTAVTGRTWTISSNGLTSSPKKRSGDNQ